MIDQSRILLRVDDVRATICRKFAEMLHEGAAHTRVRISKPHGNPEEVWFYAHREGRWVKEPGVVSVPELAAAAEGELEHLAQRGATDSYVIRSHTANDFCDADFQFQREWIEANTDVQKLDSLLQGVLFRDGHALGQTGRRSIHPHPVEGNSQR